jgi:putative endonuclease
MTRSHLKKGAEGEARAVEYLKGLGYEILHRNLRLSRYELDIVCRDRRQLVFVEVKYAGGDKYGHPATWIDKRKQQKIRRAAEIYIDKFHTSGMDIRFDALTIQNGEIEHFQNAF